MANNVVTTCFIATTVPAETGISVGLAVGILVGLLEGEDDGGSVASADGTSDGMELLVATADGIMDGTSLTGTGETLGVAVGGSVGGTTPPPLVGAGDVEPIAGDGASVPFIIIASVGASVPFIIIASVGASVPFIIICVGASVIGAIVGAAASSVVSSTKAEVYHTEPAVNVFETTTETSRLISSVTEGQLIVPVTSVFSELSTCPRLPIDMGVHALAGLTFASVVEIKVVVSSTSSEVKRKRNPKKVPPLSDMAYSPAGTVLVSAKSSSMSPIMTVNPPSASVPLPSWFRARCGLGRNGLGDAHPPGSVGLALEGDPRSVAARARERNIILKGSDGGGRSVRMVGTFWANNGTNNVQWLP
mmetsp:Transcript_29443/g.43438  ORF Transcript_29443/g.43438 Transcript_29443/m.43438 type:complete len:362 (-) Transcript_29443:6-1091(-)